jgi:hypothetical protein
MAEPLAPPDIARRAFEVVRRGYDQQAVRAFLHEVSSLVERLQRSERELRERAERAETRAQMVEHPDESTMLALLGEETTRVLTSAKDAAVEIRSKAEASAEQLIADATSEAASTRSAVNAEAEAIRARANEESEAILAQARTELARRSEEAEEAANRIREEAAVAAEAVRDEGRRDLAAAREQAEAAIDAAKVEGRSMVAEAQAVRERVLRDLQVRRKKARLQVEKLNAGRERLLQAYDVVRRTIDEATDELTVSLTDARLAADAAARRLEEEPEPTLEQLDAEVSTAGLVDLPIVDVDDHHDDEAPGPFSGEVPAIDAGTPAPPDATASTDAGPDDRDRSPSVTTITSERRTRRARRKKGFEGLPTEEMARVEPGADDEGVRLLAESTPAESEPAAGGEAGGDAPAAADAAAVEEAAAEAPAAGDAAAVDEAASDVTATTEPATTDEAEPPDAEDQPAGRAEDVFARLRAEQAPAEPQAADDQPAAADEPAAADDAGGEVAGGEVEEAPAEEAPEEEPSPDAAAFATRQRAVAPVEKELGRRLKRALADEQNEVLDLLRRAKPKGVDDLLPNADDHAARWAEVAAATLADAAAAGGTASSVLDLADELARGLVGPLRERIDRSFAASDGNLDDVADRVRALYREWKGQRLTETSRHFVVAAYGRGAFDAVEAGAQVRWTVDPSTPPCPDCDDNVLAGAITKGEDFPTGTACAPAHTGCRCLVVPA